MAQTPSKTNPAGRKRSHAAGSRARKRSLASGACAVALLVSQETKADFQVDTRYHADGRTTVLRRIKPLNFAISATPDGPAPRQRLPRKRFRDRQSARRRARLFRLCRQTSAALIRTAPR
jgi:hypothetical protein